MKHLQIDEVILNRCVISLVTTLIIMGLSWAWKNIRS